MASRSTAMSNTRASNVRLGASGFRFIRSTTSGWAVHCRPSSKAQHHLTPAFSDRAGYSKAIKPTSTPSLTMSTRARRSIRFPEIEAKSSSSDLTAERSDGKMLSQQAKTATWRGYYHTTGQAPPRLAFSESWLKALETLPSSRVFRAILPALLTSASFAALVTYGYSCGLLTISLGPTMHHLLGVPLGLLLVLRTTTAQDRSWDARQTWQNLADSCREGCRRSVVWCGKSVAGTEASRDICGAMLALVAATEAQAACESRMDLRYSAEKFTSEDLLDRMEEALGTSRSATVVAAAYATAAIQTAHEASILSEFHAMELDNAVTRMAKAAGECECIGRTPTPMEYHLHCCRFVVIFCFSLPFVFAPLHGWVSVLITTAISYALMGLDEMASVVEAPFQGYLPLKGLWAGLRSDVAHLIESAEPSEDSACLEFLPSHIDRAAAN